MRIDALYPSPRRVLLVRREIIVPNKGTEQTTVIHNVTVDRPRELIGVNPVVVGRVVLLIARVIYQERIRCKRTANNNTIHCVCLGIAVLLVNVFFMMKVTWRNEEPMYAHCGQHHGQVKREAQDGHEFYPGWHSSYRQQGKRHLLFCQLCMSRMHHHCPVGFNKAIR